MTRRGELLVAIMNNIDDLRIARDKHWYRIPISSQEKWLRNRWPPEWLAFYQTKAFGPEKHAVRYYARVKQIRQASRAELFPDQPQDEKSRQRYYQLIIDDLQQLPRPIYSSRWRRIVFIPTTWVKFQAAVEINDLYDESPLEDRLWAAFKRLGVQAERQEYVKIKKHNYALDFAVYCTSGKIDVETDGDTWHADPERIPLDNLRDNDLETAGWKLLRFNTFHIREQMEEYCLPTVVENINKLGGPDEGRLIPRRIDPDGPGNLQQMSLFDDRADQ